MPEICAATITSFAARRLLASAPEVQARKPGISLRDTQPEEAAKFGDQVRRQRHLLDDAGLTPFQRDDAHGAGLDIDRGGDERENLHERQTGKLCEQVGRVGRSVSERWPRLPMR